MGQFWVQFNTDDGHRAQGRWGVSADNSSCGKRKSLAEGIASGRFLKMSKTEWIAVG